MFELQQIDHVAITVSDLQRSVEWYQTVLGLERRHDDVWPEPAFMCVGETCVALFPASSRKPLAASKKKSHRAVGHFAFRANRENFEKARRALRERGILVEFQDHEIAHSIYFRDPDGHQLEITTYDLPKRADSP